MITITILGLSPYLLRQLSREMTKNLIEVYECGDDDIDFFAPEGLLIHNGVDQTSWNIEIRVHAPLKVKVIEDKVLKVIEGSLGNFCINAVVIFEYYSLDNRHEIIKSEYPRYLDEDSPYRNEEYTYGDDEDNDEHEHCDHGCDCDDDCDCDDECHCGKHHEDDNDLDGEEPYLGNAFEDLDKIMGK